MSYGLYQPYRMQIFFYHMCQYDKYFSRGFEIGCIESEILGWIRQARFPIFVGVWPWVYHKFI